MRVRDARKLASRARVLEAASALFEEVGYQAATIRLIAERAGLSPAGVFTTFEDKVAILCQIIGDQRRQLFEEIAELAPTLQGSARDRVCEMGVRIYAAEHPRLKLVAAYLGASFDWRPAAEEEHRRLQARLAEIVNDVLKDGVARGEIGEQIELGMMLSIICATFDRNYRHACFQNLDCEAMSRRLKRQLDIIFDGARPKGA